MSIRFALFFFAFLTSPAWSHPSYIHLGYFNCAVCHQAPEGGGLLNSYGQGFSVATALPGGEMEEEQEASSLKKVLTANDHLQHGLQARLMHVRREKSTSGRKTRTFPMQLDYLAMAQFTQSFRADLILAVAPARSTRKRGVDEATGEAQDSWQDRLYLRTLKAEWKFDQALRASAGLDLLPLGLGLVDHTAYVRERNRLAVTDIPLQGVVSYDQKTWRTLGFLFVPNPDDAQINRESGLGFRGEWAPVKGLAFGPQLLYSQGNSLNRRLFGATLRAGTPQFSYMTEFDYLVREIKGTEVDFNQWTSYQELGYWPWESVKLFGFFQTLRISDPFRENENLTGLGTEVRLYRYVSTSVEVRRTKSKTLDDRKLLAQLVLNAW